MGFFFFLLVNLTLFVRPMEIVPDLEGWRLYEFLILASFALSIPEMLTFFVRCPLGQQPITLCILGLFIATLVAQIGNPAELLRHGEFFLKILIYYLLAVSLLSSARRLRVFLAWLLVCTFLLASLTILHYHGVIQLSNLGDLKEQEKDRATGELVEIHRLQGTGIFYDPNEFCGILATVVPLCLWALGSRNRALKPLWLLLLFLMLYGIVLTGSRGGFLGLLAGLGAVCYARWGLRRTLLLGGLGLPALLLLVGGRQTDLSASRGTGQSRVQLWSDWMDRFRESPLTGGGLNLPAAEETGLKKSLWETGHLAHNSYLQAFADWGFLGGTLFLGAFLLALWGVQRYHPPHTTILDPPLRRLQPYLLGVLAAYSISILSLSMSDRVPTYLMLSLGCAFPLVTWCYPPLPAPRLSARLSATLMGWGVGFLVFTYGFIRVFVSW